MVILDYHVIKNNHRNVTENKTMNLHKRINGNHYIHYFIVCYWRHSQISVGIFERIVGTQKASEKLRIMSRLT